MIDLTPLDVRKKRGDFKRGLRGYDPEDVDGFLELVAERFEVLVRENLTLAERTERLEEQVRSQEGREKAVNDALVTAQQLREDISGQARREADNIRGNAEAESKAMVDRARVDAGMVRREVEKEIDASLREARHRLEEAQEALESLERNRARFLKSFRALLERELDGVEVEEGRSALDLPTIDLELLGGQTGDELLDAGDQSSDGLDASADVVDHEADHEADPEVDGGSDAEGEENPFDTGDGDHDVENDSSAIAGQLEDLFAASEAEAAGEGGESDPEDHGTEDPDSRAGFRFEAEEDDDRG